MHKGLYDGNETGMYDRHALPDVMKRLQAEQVSETRDPSAHMPATNIWHLNGVTLSYYAGFGFDSTRQVVPQRAMLTAYGTPEAISTIEHILKAEEAKHPPLAKHI